MDIGANRATASRLELCSNEIEVVRASEEVIVPWVVVFVDCGAAVVILTAAGSTV